MVSTINEGMYLGYNPSLVGVGGTNVPLVLSNSCTSTVSFESRFNVTYTNSFSKV